MKPNRSSPPAIIRWLGDIIDTELTKPDQEIDLALIEECETFLRELMEERYAPTDRQMTERLAQIKARAARPLPRRRLLPASMGRWVACACILLTVALGAVAIPALPAFREQNNIPADTTQTNGTTHTDATTLIESTTAKTDPPPVSSITDTRLSYADIVAFSEAQSLTLLYPARLPLGLQVTRVDMNVTENASYVSYVFSEPLLDMFVILDSEQTPSDADETVTLHGSDLVVHLSAPDGSYCAILTHEGNTYRIQTMSRQVLTAVLDNLTEAAPPKHVADASDHLH